MRPLPDDMHEKVRRAAGPFAQHGLDGVKMDELAKVTGVPKATLYYYFDGKEDVLGFLFHDVLDAMGEAIDAAVRSEGTAAERLRGVIAAHLGVVERMPEATMALQFELGRAARLPLVDERIEAAFRSPVRKLLKEGAVDGSLRPVAHPGLVAVAVLGAVSTVAVNAISLGPIRPVTELVDEVVAVVLDGLAA